MALAIRKRGRFWYARGTVPMRQADGSIKKVRIEESTREVAKARARRFADDLAQYYHEQAYRPKTKASPSFTDAALTYVESKNPSKKDRWFVARLVAHFADRPIAEIDQAEIAAAAQILYPGRSAATHNRAVFAPCITVLRLSGRSPTIQRPRVDRKSVNIPRDEWYSAVLPKCPPRLAALLVFLTLTGRRISEALVATDNGNGTATIGRTKTGAPVVVAIPDLCRGLLGGLPGAGKRLFTYGGNRHNVKRGIKWACERAGVPYYGTHALGRHAFATRLLREGKSLKFVADAGGWASIKMPAQHYAHLEKSEVQEQVRAVGEEWGKRLAKRQKMAETKD